MTKPLDDRSSSVVTKVARTAKTRGNAVQQKIEAVDMALSNLLSIGASASPYVEWMRSVCPPKTFSSRPRVDQNVSTLPIWEEFFQSRLEFFARLTKAFNNPDCPLDAKTKFEMQEAFSVFKSVFEEKFGGRDRQP